MRRYIAIVIMFLTLVIAPTLFLSLYLSPNEAFELSGRVVDENGQPLADFDIEATVSYDPDRFSLPIPWSNSVNVQFLRTKTDGDGRFVLKGSGLNLRVGFLSREYTAVDYRKWGFDLDRKFPNQAIERPVTLVVRKAN